MYNYNQADQTPEIDALANDAGVLLEEMKNMTPAERIAAANALTDRYGYTGEVTDWFAGVTTENDARGKFPNAQQARNYMLAGNAIITIKSVATGRHFTFHISKPSDNSVNKPKTNSWFVRVMIENGDSMYLGMIRGGIFRATAKSKGVNGQAFKGFAWTWNKLLLNQLPDSIEIYHEGKCGRCGRRLTNPDSIESGIGPECKKLYN